MRRVAGDLKRTLAFPGYRHRDASFLGVSKARRKNGGVARRRAYGGSGGMTRFRPIGSGIVAGCSVRYR